MTERFPNRLSAVLLAVLVGMIAAAIAFASSSGGPGSAGAAPDAAVEKARAAFAVLRAPANGNAHANNPFERSPRSSPGVDPAEARVVMRGRSEYWVGASSEVLCINARVIGSGVAAGGCRPVAGAENDGFFTGSRPAPDSPDAGKTRIAGIVPDGVDTVTITLVQGTTIDVAVQQNIVAATFDDAPASARFVTADDRTVVSKLGG